MMGTRMSTPPPTLSRSLTLAWRTLRSMRTALILLLLLALGSIAGSLLPQWPNSAARVTQYQTAHPFWGSFLERAGLFDVFGSWWFVLITVLLFVSLVACLIPRTRSVVRAFRARPVQAREIDAFPQHHVMAVTDRPDAAIDAARRVMRRRGYRVARDPQRPGLAGEKGLAREAGSLLFHWAFILILVGVIFGKGTGYSGYALVVEGDTWFDAAANYDGQIRTGRFFDGSYTGTGIELQDFGSAYRQTGQPMDFVSRVTLLQPDGSPIRQQDIRVNHPAEVNGLRIYQVNFGWAPRITIRDPGGVVFDDEVVMDRVPAPDGVAELAMPWRGVVKLPGVGADGRDVAIELQLWPDGEAYTNFLVTGEPTAMLRANHPVLRYSVWQGRLTDLANDRLDTSLMRRTAKGLVGEGLAGDLTSGRQLSSGDPSSGSTISFPALGQYSVFQVSRDAGVPIVLVAAILILVGLLPALYTSRRKVWVRAEPARAGSTVEIGGFALQRKPQFQEEFAKLVDAIAKAAGSPDPTQPSEPKEKVGIP
jgi:cytochrome c biogenesis protein